MTYNKAVRDIIEAGNRLDQLNLAPATSGNYSIRLDDGVIAITVSGAHKGMLGESDIMRVDMQGNPQEDKKPSAETLLHCMIYKAYPHVNAILHTHSVANTVLTRAAKEDSMLVLEGYEMLKAYDGIDTHDTSVSLPIFDNTQDMVALSTEVAPILERFEQLQVFLIRGHGIYGWGQTMGCALRVIEATEMLLSCEMHAKLIQSSDILVNKSEGQKHESLNNLSGHAA